MTRFCSCPESFAFSLESSGKRNQLAEASCKNCGGRSLVDGIGPISRSMLGTVGLEVTKSINPELSWKTVTKGKRSRKSVPRTNGRVALGCKSPKRVGDFSGSDSDKFGEAGIRQCFPDKSEHVPIKKRRHYLRSPSPSSRISLCGGESVSPQLCTPSSHSEDLEHLSDHNGSSGSYTNRPGFIEVRISNGVNDGVVGDKDSEVTGGELYNSDNFSGIALLAAVACNNNIVDDPCDCKGDAMEVSSAPQKSDASTSCLQVRESFPSSESGKQMQKDVSLLDAMGCSFIVEGTAGAPCRSDENEGSKSVASKVDRRHWDLNTPMDAWEQPNDDACDQYNCLDASIDDDMQKVNKHDKEGCEFQKEPRINGNDTESCLPLNRIEVHSSTTKMKENESDEPCHDISSTKETGLSILSGYSMEPIKFSPADTKVSSHVLGSNASTGNFPLSESCNSSEVSGGNEDTNSRCVSTVRAEDSCRDASSLLITSEQNVALPSDLEKLGGENGGQLKDAEDTEKTSELPDDRIALREKYIGTCKTLDAENLEITSENKSNPSSKGGDLSISDMSVRGHSTVICDIECKDEKVLDANALGTDAGRHSGSKHEEPHVCNGKAEGSSTLQNSGKGLVLDDCHNSDVSQDDHGHVDGRDDDELQLGYDSPYEDGELRGSVLYSWEGFEFEEGENECLDYESDGRGGEDSDAVAYPCSKIVEAASEASRGTEKKGSTAAIQVPEPDSRKSSSVKSSLRGELKENREKIVTPVKKDSNQGSGTTEEFSTGAIVERNNGSMRRDRTSDQMDGVDVKGSYAGEVGLKTTRGKLQSQIEGPSALDAMERDNVYTQHSRSRNSGSSYSRAERDGSPDRFVTRYRSAIHERERNGSDSQLVYWNSRNHYPSGYRGPEGHGTTRPRAYIANSVDKFGGVNSHNQKQSINYSSRAERDNSPDRFATRYRSAVHERERSGSDDQLFYWESRNRCPSSYRGTEGQGQTRPRSAMADSVNKFGGLNSHDHKQSLNYSSKSMQRPLGWRRSPINRDDYHGGQRRMLGFSSNRSWGGSRNFSEGVGGLREEYHQHVNEDAAASVRMPHYLSWKERSFFAVSNRGARVSIPRRSSRSRSRTRSPHAWQPQRRRHSRSPDFRSEGRMDRMRAQFQKPSFAADYGEAFMSPPRGGRFSPQRNFRGVDDRNFVDSHLRHRRSPSNVFRQGQRLDSTGLSGRLKTEDDSFRPMMRPGRFPPSSSVGRGCKLEENNDDKRHDDRSGMMR
ncbi:hypothetical protein ACH5RR_019704 [Cinchona calisaya]|uniref:Uncharacterized protein n=1 Tax=Cinchona calisaya TaxID=153742 RepID=A0ABD2ZQ37_9GENT